MAISFALRFRARINGVEVFLLFRDDRNVKRFSNAIVSSSSRRSGSLSEYALLLRVLVLRALFAAYVYPSAGFHSDAASNAISTMQPSREMPSPYIRSKPRLTKRRRNLVLDDLGANMVSNDLAITFDGVDATYVDSNAGEELQGTTAGCGFAAEHHADFSLAQLD